MCEPIEEYEHYAGFERAVCKDRTEFWRMLNRTRETLAALPLETLPVKLTELMCEIDIVLANQPEEV